MALLIVVLPLNIVVPGEFSKDRYLKFEKTGIREALFKKVRHLKSLCMYITAIQYD